MLLLAAAALLAGCASNADTSQSSPRPEATGMIESILPGATDSMGSGSMPGAMATDNPMQPGAGIDSIEDTRTRSKAMEEAVEKLTEVEDAWVVAAGHTALVGLKFTTQYQGQVDDRLKKMVLARIQTVEKGVTGIAVTNDTDLVRQIEKLSDGLEDATDLSAVNQQLEELARKITVYTE